MSMFGRSLRSTPLAELVCGSAHEAHPTDVTAPLGERFAGQTILALHTALDRAATVRVCFDATGRPQLSGIRNIKQRTGAEFGEVLRAEAAATKARWVVVVMATGWQAVLGQRAARAEATDDGAGFARYRTMFETPEIVVPRAQVDRVYTAIDHPSLDKSVVFSVRRREIEDIMLELRRVGLGVAAIRLGVASQLEAWLAGQSEAGLARDLLLSDGLTALLLNVERGDYVPPRGAVDSEHPRQSAQRPSAIEEDIVRFIHANGERSVTFIGSEELCAAIKKSAPGAEIVRPPGIEAHDTQLVALSRVVRHDLNFEAREVRPALPKSWRRFAWGYAVVVCVLAAVASLNAVYAARVRYDSYQLEVAAATRAGERQQVADRVVRAVEEHSTAADLRTWVAANYHAQRLSYWLLRQIPASAGVDKLTLEVRDGQLALTFVILGDAEAQLEAHRSVEKAIAALRFKIAGEDLPSTSAGTTARAVQYRMNLIAPDAAEAAGP